MPWLADHQVGGSSVFPAAGFVEMVLAAGSLRHPDQPVQIEDFEIRTPLILDVRHSKTVRLKLDEHGGHFLISSRDRLSDDPWQPHVTGRIAAQATRTQPPVPQVANDADIHLGTKEIYDAARKIGLDYGPAFQAVETVEGAGRLIATQLGLPASVEASLDKFLIHPCLLYG
jgi:acyl transferase domain-containing protein